MTGNGVYRRLLAAVVVSMVAALPAASPVRADDAAPGVSRPDVTAPVLVSSGVAAAVTRDQRMRFSWAFLDPAVDGDTTSGIDRYDLQTEQRSPGASGFEPWVDHPRVGGVTSFDLGQREDFDTCFRIRAHDLAGNVSDWSPVACSVIDWTPPAGTTRSASRVVNGTLLLFGYQFTDLHGVASYDVEYREALMGVGMGPWTHPAAWYGTTGTTLARRTSAGSDTCFRVRARDRAGNVTGWSQQQCQAAPVNDTALVAKGDVRRVPTTHVPSGQVSTMLGGWDTLTSRPAHATSVVIGARFGSDQGSAMVYLGGMELGTIGYGAVSPTWTQFWMQLPTTLGGQLRIVRLPGRKPVTIDWVAFLQQ